MKNFVYILLFLLAINVFAIEPLVTDRPDQTESSSTVPQYNLQIETGMLYEQDEFTWNNKTYKDTNFGIATTLFRYGLTEKIELRLGSAYVTGTSYMEDNKVGTWQDMENLDVGSKIYLSQENGYLPEAAVILTASLPIVNEVWSSGKGEYSVLFAMSHTLSSTVGLGYNAGILYDEFEEINWIYSAALGFQVFENTSAFVEIYGHKRAEHDAQFLFDAGLTHLLSETFQLDVSGGVALTEDSTDWFASLGFSYRLALK